MSHRRLRRLERRLLAARVEAVRASQARLKAVCEVTADLEKSWQRQMDHPGVFDGLSAARRAATARIRREREERRRARRIAERIEPDPLETLALVAERAMDRAWAAYCKACCGPWKPRVQAFARLMRALRRNEDFSIATTVLIARLDYERAVGSGSEVERELARDELFTCEQMLDSCRHRLDGEHGDLWRVDPALIEAPGPKRVRWKPGRIDVETATLLAEWPEDDSVTPAMERESDRPRSHAPEEMERVIAKEQLRLAQEEHAAALRHSPHTRQSARKLRVAEARVELLEWMRKTAPRVAERLEEVRSWTIEGKARRPDEPLYHRMLELMEITNRMLVFYQPAKDELSPLAFRLYELRLDRSTRRHNRAVLEHGR